MLRGKNRSWLTLYYVAVPMLFPPALCSAQGLAFYPMTPCRVADTRPDQGFAAPFGAPGIGPSATRDFPLPSSTRCPIPASAQAYSLNVTVVPQGPLSFLSIWQAGQPYPNVSTLNSPSGAIIANAAIVPAGSGGAVTVLAGNPTDLLIDINGYFAPPGAPGALSFYPMTPCRVADTRSDQGFAAPFGPPGIGPSATRDFPLPSSTRCPIPTSAQAYSLNVTAVPQGPLGFLSIWRAGQPYPYVSTLNSPNGAIIANAAIVPAGNSGGVTVLAGNPTDLLIDINGYFAPPGGPGALSFFIMTPCRVADTRPDQGFAAPFGAPGIGPSATRDFPLPSSARCPVPASAQAYSLNVTVVPQGPLGFLSIWQAGQPYPYVSTLNSPSGATIANAAIVPAGSSGAVTVLAGNPTDLLIDINGYFASSAQGPSLAAFTACVGPQGSGATCTLPVGTYTVSQPIVIGRSNVTVTGGSSDRSRTILVRDPTNTAPMMQVDAPQSLTGITIQNLTFCGNSTLPKPSPSTTCPAPVRTTCGDWTNQASTPNAPPPPGQCVDLQVENADTGLNPANPFSNAGPYSVTIANTDFEDATGHAITLFPNGTLGKRVKDVYMHDSAVNSSAITGILAGANGGDYRAGRVCDANPNFNNDLSVFLPRNIRIENTAFQNNNTGSVAMIARWVGLRNNTFNNNYIRPQVVGNEAGGNVFIDQCTDTVQIYNNVMTGPSTYPLTSGLELWGRNLDIQGNTITGFPNEGIGGNSVYNANIAANHAQNNGWHTAIGGILAWTSGPGGPCDAVPRDTQTVTISGNTSTGQAYGVFLGDRDSASRDTINNLVITGDNTLQPGAEVFMDPFVTLNGASIAFPITSRAPQGDQTLPRALPVQAISPAAAKCSTPGSDRETFTFSASDVFGAGNIFWLQGTFSIAGNDADGGGGPDGGAQGCHFIYYAAPYNTLYLDGPNGGSNWSGSSPVGPGGSDLSNGYCTIHAGSPASQVQTEPKILNLTLDVEFPFSSSTSSRKHMFVITSDYNNQLSNGGAWKYWGWWATP
jgi:hypothetical protein